MEDYDFEYFKYIPQLTLKEINALSTYKSNSDRFCSILTEGYEVEKSYNNARAVADDDVNLFLLAGYKYPQNTIEIMCNLYSAIYKMSKQRAESTGERLVYRGTRTKEATELMKTGMVSKFLSTTDNRTTAVGRFALSWKTPALMRIKIPNSVPYIKYSSVVGIRTGHGGAITDLDEDEILVSPFCAIDVDEGEYTHVGYGEYLTEYRASISKAPLQEISAEEDKQGMEYLNDHSAECTKMMESLLNYEFLREQMDLQKRIREIRAGISDLRRHPVGEHTKEWIAEDLEKVRQYEARIKELEDKEKSAEQSVNKFKKILRSVCMSRCKGIERKIDLDYESQKEEFIRRKNDKELQNRIKQKKSIVQMAHDLGRDAKINSSKLSTLLRHKEYIEQLSVQLDIPYVEYLKNPSELVATNEQAMAKFEEINTPISEFEKQNIDDISEQTLAKANELMDNVNNNVPEYSTLYKIYKGKQNSAFLFAIHQKLLWHKSILHYNNLSRELQEIQGRSTLDKVKDFFKGESRYKREMAKQIQNALLIIADRKAKLEHTPSHYEKVEPQMVYEELEQMRDILSAGVTDRFGIMRHFIVQNFDVDTNIQVNQRQEQNSEGILPAIQQKNKKMSASQKMELFLKSNGYIQEQEDNSSGTPNSSQSVYIDEAEQTAGLCIQRNRRCAEYLSKLEGILMENHEMQAPQIQGRGSGFHMVR